MMEPDDLELEPAPQRALRILVAEDSRTQAQRLRYLLERDGYIVAVAANGRLALEQVPEFQPDLVISDVNMPEMDGYVLSHRLKQEAQTREIPVILVTTMSDPQDVIRGLECGADSFVLKPYDERYMLGRVRYVLANREMRRHDDPAVGVGIFFHGQRHFITADRLQILNLLLSTYEAAIQRNRELLDNKESLEKRSAEIALANRFLDRVIENIPHMIFVKDAQELRFVRVNRALEEFLGRGKEQLVGRNDHDFFPPEQANHFVAKDREVMASGAVGAFDEPIETLDRGTRMLHTRKLAIYDEENVPRFLLGISEDVTEKKEREGEILRLNAALEQRTAEADAANRAKSTFLATMSHEIRTPMNGMLGMLELLALTALDADQRATLEIVRESSASLLRIVDDILDFSKIEAGQLEMRPEPTSIAQVLKEVERMYSGAARAKGLALQSEADPRLPPALLVDPLRLRQILANFVGNALKFTPQGSIHLEAESLGMEGPLARVRLLVHDTGIGISPENQQRLFQPFSQGDVEAARRAGGTGLGLTICRRLATMMGGTVEMQSALGHGTTMVVNLALPLAAADPRIRREAVSPTPGPAAPARRAPDTAQAEAEGTLVLLVDDHPTNRMLLLRQLNTLGYAAEAAEDGEQALRLWRSGRFATVITDCEMPRMDGYQLARGIRAEEAAGGLPRMPILACTAHALAGEAEKCRAAGMDDSMTKPIALRRLQEKLQRWLPLPPEAPAAVEAPAADRVLDLEHIASTWGEDPATMREILEFFRRSNDEDAEQLRGAVNARELAEVTRASHRMLGASRMVGAVGFAAVSERIHRASRSGDWSGVDAAMAQFEDEYARLNACIEAAGAPAG
ncbi:MAG TPA: response regulator [Ramlibacter sp.]|nr:response regulator [Ramlibacter sp.]